MKESQSPRGNELPLLQIYPVPQSNDPQRLPQSQCNHVRPRMVPSREPLARKSEALHTTVGILDTNIYYSKPTISKFAKSTDNNHGKKMLLSTGQHELVYAAHDVSRGIGMSADGAEEKRAEWGENLYGKVLREIREWILAEEEDEADDGA